MASPPSTVESTIRGNVSDDVKNDIHQVMTGLVFEPTFAWSVGSKLRITDVDRLDASQGALVNGGPLETTTARVICELDVDGCQLRIVSSSVTMDDGLGTSKCEIWEAKEGVLIASGSHTKMRPSASKL
ncbi:hypothetical protein FS837_005605 [Tulasnella sp. UAMH 9824]|nr:hypothetical protein FS837_005605 [Tulasnella sp. UAMH 9824]